MRVKIPTTMAVIFLSFGVANADAAFTSSQENGVQIFRGTHGPAVSRQAIAFDQRQKQLLAQQKQLQATKKLNQQMAAQSKAISELKNSVGKIETQQTRPTRRRVYYGNPAFFGRNGFIGNRFHGGGTIPLPRRRHYGPGPKR